MSEDKENIGGAAVVSLKELSQFGGMGGMGSKYNYGLMSILKSKGAPIVGVFNMEPDIYNYSWTSEYNPSSSDIFVTWDKVK